MYQSSLIDDFIIFVAFKDFCNSVGKASQTVHVFLFSFVIILAYLNNYHVICSLRTLRQNQLKKPDVHLKKNKTKDMI